MQPIPRTTRFILLLVLVTNTSAFTVPLHAAAPKTRPCGEVSDQALFIRIAETYRSFSANWLVIGEDWFSSYTSKIEDKNPLLPSKHPAKNVTGFVWAKDVACTAIYDKPKKTWKMRITGRHIKFNEEGGGWISAVKKGTLAEFMFTQTDGAWNVTDRTAEVSVLGSDDAESKPRPGDLPSRQMQPKR